MKTDIKRILWPTDFSPISLEAASVALRYSELCGAELHVIHVAPLLVWDSSRAVETAGDALVGQIDVRGPAERRLKKIVQDCFGDAPVIWRVEIGTPWLEICNYATEKSIDLIVISTHGLTGLKHVLLGSVAERVVQHANCSVLVVKNSDSMRVARSALEQRG